MDVVFRNEEDLSRSRFKLGLPFNNMGSGQSFGLEVAQTVFTAVSAYVAVVGLGLTILLHWRKPSVRAEATEEA